MTNDEHNTIRITSGSPTEEEVAAVTALLSALASESDALGAHVETPVESAWTRSQRSLRSPLAQGPGRWQRFGR
ncbi:MAG: acyl-CoA carboxylase subunit epsilon [Mycetocola sp.]